MRNAVLHLITNKTDSFGITGLPTSSLFRPYVPTAAETAIREALHINDGSYYLTNSLAAVYAFPDILAEFKETESTFLLHNIIGDELLITNASYYNTPTTNFNIAHNPVVLPGADYFNWRLTYNNSSVLNIKYANKHATITYTLEDRVLTADWPLDSGIRGALQLDTDYIWTQGAQVSLYVPPVSFPFTAAVKIVTDLPGTSTVLNNSGLARNYFNAQSGVEKYALLMLAIARPDLRNTGS